MQILHNFLVILKEVSYFIVRCVCLVRVVTAFFLCELSKLHVLFHGKCLSYALEVFLRACSYGPGRWDGPLRRDPAERLLSIQKHCSVHIGRRAGPLGGIPVQGYRDPSYRDRQIGSAPAHCPIWTAHPTYRDEKLPCLLWLHFARFGFTRSNIRVPVITWQNTSQRPGQNFPMWTREKIRLTWWAVPPTGLALLHMNRAQGDKDHVWTRVVWRSEVRWYCDFCICVTWVVCCLSVFSKSFAKCTFGFSNVLFLTFFYIQSECESRYNFTSLQLWLDKE